MEIDAVPDFDSYIEQLIQYIPPQNEPIDLIISTGGLAAYYAAGVVSVFAYLQRDKKIKINKIYCGSGGVFTAIPLILSEKYTNLKLNDFISLYSTIINDYNDNNTKIVDSSISKFRDYLTPDAYKLCSNKLYIYKTELPFLTKKEVHTFTDNEHLLSCLKASSTVPYLTTKDNYVEIDNKKFIDCFFLPKIQKEHNIRQVYINLVKYDYPMYKRIFPIDKNIICIILEGILDSYRFIKYNKSTPVIYEYNGLYSKYKYIKYFSFILLFFIIYKKYNIFSLYFWSKIYKRIIF